MLGSVEPYNTRDHSHQTAHNDQGRLHILNVLICTKDEGTRTASRRTLRSLPALALLRESCLIEEIEVPSGRHV